MAPFLPPLLAGQEGHPASHTSPTLEGEPSADWWDLVRPGQVAEARPMDTGAAQQHRGQAGQDWERGGGSESAAAPPIPATLLEGTRVKVTGHPLSPDGRPPPARAPPQLTDGHGGSACAVASGVCGGTCLSPPRWREGGRDRGDGPATVLRSHYQRSPWDQSLLHPAHSSPSACSLQEQSKVG